jgi:hypothetical protein
MGSQGNILFLAPFIFEGGRASIYTRWFSDLTSVNIVKGNREGKEKTEWGILGYPKTIRDLTPHLVLMPRC